MRPCHDRGHTCSGEFRIKVNGRLHVGLNGSNIQAASESAYEEHGCESGQLGNQCGQVEGGEASLPPEERVDVPEGLALQVEVSGQVRRVTCN